MDFVQNFPSFSIVLCMGASIISSALKEKAAKWVNLFVVSLTGMMSLSLLFYLIRTGESFVYQMGMFPAPWGNELRAGILEAGMAFFSVLLCSYL